MSEQLGLFESTLSPKGKLSKFGWSPSRHDILMSCPRKYYYNYYGSRIRGKDPNNLYINELKKYKPSYFVEGDLTHMLIKHFFKKQRTEDDYEYTTLINWSRILVEQAVEYSKNYEKLKGTYEFEPPIIYELVTKRENPEIVEERIGDGIDTSLSNLFESKKFQFLLEGAQYPEAELELSISLPLTKNLKVTGIIDLIFRSSGTTICDWKTGKIEDETESIQLYTYASWAQHECDIKADNVTLFKAFTKHNELKEYKFSQDIVLRSHAAIKQSFELMTDLDAFGLNADKEAFTKCKQLEICNQCPYYDVCKP